MQERLSKKAKNNPETMTLLEWQLLMDKETFHFTREKGTEKRWSSLLNFEDSKGVYNCASCNQSLFESTTKFDAGNGWPSFSELIMSQNVSKSFWKNILSKDNSDSVRYEKDERYGGVTRIEVLCARCNAHLGHLFQDSRTSTGKRYCMNGASLSFNPDSKSVKGKSRCNLSQKTEISKNIDFILFSIFGVDTHPK